MWGVSDKRGVDYFVSCSLLLSCGMSPAECRKGLGKKHKKRGKKTQKNTKKHTQKQLSSLEKPMLIRRGAVKRKKEKKRRKKKGRGAGLA
jgi:hypothetical protein